MKPPKPSKKDMDRFGWFLTGECRKPNPNRWESFCCLTEFFMPWSSQTGKATVHEIYGENRWIIEPKPVKPYKIHFQIVGNYELGLCGSFAPYTYRRTNDKNRVTCKRCIKMLFRYKTTEDNK